MTEAYLNNESILTLRKGNKCVEIEQRTREDARLETITLSYLEAAFLVDKLRLLLKKYDWYVFKAGDDLGLPECKTLSP